MSSYDDALALLPSLHSTGIPAFFGFGVTVDHDDSTRHLLWLAQSGLGLPDRDSYDGDTEANAALRTAYVDHVAAQLVNTGIDAEEAADLAVSVLALETSLAAHQLRAEERRDPRNTLNRHDLDALVALAPDLDLKGYLAAIGADGVESVNVQAPAYFAALHEVVSRADAETLRAYLTFHVVRTVAGALTAAVSDESFDFYGRRIEGKQEQKERYQRVVAALGQDMGEALGHRFVDETFPPRAKERAQAMVDEIVAEMRRLAGDPAVDGRGDPRPRAAREARLAPGEDRLPRRVAGLVA